MKYVCVLLQNTNVKQRIYYSITRAIKVIILLLTKQ